MRGDWIPYSQAELEFIEARRTLPRREAHKAFVEAFGRTDVSPQNFKALCTRKGWSTGRNGQFPKGNVPANKGKAMPFHPNSARTRFKKGQLPHNTKYAGHERVSKDGYVEISIEETNPHTGFERRYVLKHRWLWEQENGPVPDGMALKCLDGNRRNTDPSNWKLIPRGMLPRLNGIHGRRYDEAPAEIKPSILAVTELEHRVFELSGGRKPARKARAGRPVSPVRPRCRRAGCTAWATWVPKLNIPARGWAIDSHRPVTVIMNLEVCMAHFDAERMLADLLTPDLKALIREQLVGRVPPDFDRAWISKVPVDSDEYRQFEEVAHR